jgi:hypothetical protein
MELVYRVTDESSYLKTLQKPLDCHKTVIIEEEERKRGRNIIEGQKAQANT